MTLETDMAATAAERRTATKAVASKDAPSNGLTGLFFELVDSLRAEEGQRKDLLERMRGEVERGDKMLAEHGIDRPSKAR